MKPLLTVVIPVYNVEKYLKRCIESILIQEWKNYDILLVDDGSTDNSPQICDDYAKAYDFISVSFWLSFSTMEKDKFSFT